MDTYNRAENIILKFKQHLQQKWKKNKVKQQINKIIHYHAQKTFFARYAAPLFLKVPEAQEFLTQKFSAQNLKNTPLQEQVKILHSGFILNDKYSKSMEVIQIYFKKLTQFNLVEEFFQVIMHILYEIPCAILPKELVDEGKKDLFVFVSPIIAFLIVYWWNSQGKKKVKTLEELIMRSGVKSLLKVVKVPKIDKNQLSHQKILNQNQLDNLNQNDSQKIQETSRINIVDIKTISKSLSSQLLNQQQQKKSVNLIEEEDTDLDQNSIVSLECFHDMSTEQNHIDNLLSPQMISQQWIKMKQQTVSNSFLNSCDIIDEESFAKQ